MEARVANANGAGLITPRSKSSISTRTLRESLIASLLSLTAIADDLRNSTARRCQVFISK